MVKKLLLFLILFFVSTILLSQEKKTLILGKITDSIGAVNNVNVLNLNSRIGTSSNDNGFFEMRVGIGDSLRFSSVQHSTKIIYISKNIFKSKKIAIQLKIETTTLDEFELKRHNLSGFLGIDTRKAPTNRKDSLLSLTMDFSNIDWNAPVLDDFIDKNVRPPQVNTMAGAMPMAGSGASFGIPMGGSKELWALRRKLAKKKAFPAKILSEFGEVFFFKKLKIPIENYYHFLEYCNPLGIEKLYEKGKTLTLIKILQEQSKSYLKTIKKD